jgi:hypothetical protein
MKKTLLLLSMFLVAFNMNAQDYNIVDGNDEPMIDGNSYSFNTIEYPENSIDFYITNISSEDIRMRIEVVSITNTDGTLMELCFDLCYDDINVGQSYPGDYVLIAPGDTSFPGNHFVNRNPGNGSDVLEYVFRYYQVDTNGDETGTDLTITYLYDPQLGVNDVNKLDLNIQSTMISDVLEMDTMEDLTLQVYDINGKVIMSQNLEAGQQRIDMSQLSTQYYILHFTNNKGVSDVVKVMKR